VCFLAGWVAAENMSFDSLPSDARVLLAALAVGTVVVFAECLAVIAFALFWKSGHRPPR